MIDVSKSNREVSSMQWKLGNELVEETKSYCYLGVVFENTGLFNLACKALKDKALGAMFSLLRNINKHRTVCPSLLFELFLINWWYRLFYIIVRYGILALFLYEEILWVIM